MFGYLWLNCQTQRNPWESLESLEAEGSLWNVRVRGLRYTCKSYTSYWGKVGYEGCAQVYPIFVLEDLRSEKLRLRIWVRVVVLSDDVDTLTRCVSFEFRPQKPGTTDGFSFLGTQTRSRHPRKIPSASQSLRI
jgi:hypothetical protein